MKEGFCDLKAIALRRATTSPLGVLDDVTPYFSVGKSHFPVKQFAVGYYRLAENTIRNTNRNKHVILVSLPVRFYNAYHSNLLSFSCEAEDLAM